MVSHVYSSNVQLGFDWVSWIGRRLVPSLGGLLLIGLGCALMPSPWIAVACFAAIVVAIVACLRPRLALLLLFIGAGLPSITLPLPGHNMHLVEPATMLLLIVIIVQRPSVRFGISHLLALLFISIAVISFIHVPEISVGASKFSTYGADKKLISLLIIFTAFFVGTCTSGMIEDRGAFLVEILLVSLPLYGVGLAQVLGIHLPSLLESPDAYNPQMTQGRLWGPFPWSVNFGMYLVNLLAIAVVCWFHGRRRAHRVIGFLMTVATFLGIIGSGTRSAILAAMIIFIIACLMSKRGKTLFLSLGIAIVTCIPFIDKINSLFSHDASSTSNRLFLWNEAIQLILAHPWLGIGLQQFHYYYAQLIVGRATELDPIGIHPHEQYLEWAMESGILWSVIGILLILSIMFTCGIAYYRISKKEVTVQSRNNGSDGIGSLQNDKSGTCSLRSVMMVVLLAMIGNCIMGFLDVPFDQLEGTTFLFLLAGLAIGMATSERSPLPNPRLLRPLRLIAPDRMNQNKPIPEISEAITVLSEKPPIDPTLGDKQRCDRTRSYPEEVPWPQRGDLQERPEEQGSEGNEQPLGDHAPSAQKTSRSVVIQLLSWGIAIPLIFPMTALLTRYLGPTQYGEYSLTFPFLTIFALLSGTGMDPLIIRQLSRQPRSAWSEILSYAVGTRLFSTFLSIILAMLTACLLPISLEQRSLFLLGGISLFFSFSFNGLRIIYSHGFRAEQRAWPLAVMETTNRLITAGLIALIVWQHYPLFWAYALIIYSDLPMFFIQLFMASRRYHIRILFSFKRFWEHMRGSLPLLGHNALTLLTSQIDICVLMVVSGPAIAGIYALASRITDPLISIAFAYVNGLYPWLCTSFEEGRERFSEVCYKATRVLALAIIPLGVGVMTEASVLVNLLGGQRFAAATIAVQLLMWAMVVIFFNQLGERICTAANMEHRVPLVTAVSATANLVLNIALIPHWQVMGASLAALLSESIGLIIFAVQIRQQIRLWPIIGMLSLIILSNLPSLALLLFFKNLSIFIALPLATLLTLISYLITRTITISDIKQIIHIFIARSNRNKAARDPKFQPALAALRLDPRDERSGGIGEERMDREALQWHLADEDTLILPRMHI